MIHISFTRTEWSIIAGMIANADPGRIPAGLAERVAALLRATPAAWPNEPCVLDLDTASAGIVDELAATRRGLANAERIIHTHQEGNEAASHRIELRSKGVSSVIAHLTDSTDLHRQLQHHAARLLATAATGHLALVERASLKVLAVAFLQPEDTGD